MRTREMPVETVFSMRKAFSYMRECKKLVTEENWRVWERLHFGWLFLTSFTLSVESMGGWGAWPPRLAASAPTPAIGSLQLLGARGRHQSTGQHSHHPVGLRAHQGAPAREGGQLTYCTLLSGGMRGALYRYGFNTHTCRYRVKIK